MSSDKISIGIIGGGAAGFFGAVSAAEKNPEYDITIFEKSPKLLSKVRISGGGRCNVTNSVFELKELVSKYPRGNKELYSVFSRFGTRDTVEWFESRGVKLKTEEDGRIFPASDDSASIVNCLLSEAEKYGVKILTSTGLVSIEKTDVGFTCKTTGRPEYNFDKLLVACGGFNDIKGYDFLANLGHTIQKPVPSLFTFNSPYKIFDELEGLSVNDAHIKVEGTKLKEKGPLLITHAGLSGPAVLKLSARGARELHEIDYNFILSINWVSGDNYEKVKLRLKTLREKEGIAKISKRGYFKIPQRLWERLIAVSGVDFEKKWNEISNKDIDKISLSLTDTRLPVKEKSTFKEEFVTCGGISLKEVNFKTMESRVCPGLYFAGEVLDIDGITGGFNFQSAWSTAWIFGNSV